MITSIATLPPEECEPVPDAGLGTLVTERGNLPLESVDVTAAVSGLIAGVEVVQGFRNPHDVALEATYVFPLPDRAAVTAFRMEADGRVIEGTLKERGQARADYDQAVAEGRRAAIAEEDRPDVFTIRVGNIVPGERVTVHLTLNQPLPYEDGAATFRFPLVVAPRYIPGTPLDGGQAGDGWAPDTDAVPDASRITPPVLLPGFPNPVRLSLAVSVDPAGLELRELRSSLHVVQEEGSTVRLQPGERLDRDFILRLSFDASTSLALVPDDGEGDADGDGTFSLTVVPDPAPATAAAKDVVLVLDRSGSMTGWKMVAARRAAARIVDTLTRGDRFAVLSFDTVVERPEGLGEGLSEASDRNRYRAVEHLARLEARGGTEMLAPLEQAVALLAGSDGDRVLVLVTDGQVGNEDQILERVGARLAGVRVHTVGIDRAVNAGFLGRLAGLGSGRCELVESEDRLDEAMEHIHRRIGAPLVTDLSLKADGLDLVPGTVSHLGSIYPGVPLTVLGRYRHPRDGALTVHGVDGAVQPWERRVAGVRTDSPATRAIWARARLRALEDRYAAGDHSLEGEIVEISLEYGVLCRFTAFVAVDSKVVAEGGPGHRVIQPVELPSGWQSPAVAAAPMMMTAMAPPQPGAPAGPPGAPGAAPKFAAGGMGGAPRGVAAGGSAPRARMAPPRPAPVAAPAAARELPRAELGEELRRLRAAESLGAADQLRYLQDLGSRLAALAVHLGGHAELEALARDLQSGTDVDALWQRAVDGLEALSRSGGRRPFWKR
ncbi:MULTISPECIES: VIT domain-containing protein [Streptosporangium]|uniref:Ca-activated chloride channel family protein n=1 Tax=Streptosporangium brasiliense TaxID=47480 RepID=A0ABT9QXL3_9ACTN|nr:VIT domain-containing protein [Streptosporangium brasiliense]MDP9861738.1 Ca-activated chloride channel family protein [Streptosporangium brasiliense]